MKEQILKVLVFFALFLVGLSGFGQNVVQRVGFVDEDTHQIDDDTDVAIFVNNDYRPFFLPQAPESGKVVSIVNSTGATVALFPFVKGEGGALVYGILSTEDVPDNEKPHAVPYKIRVLYYNGDWILIE